MVGLPQVYPNGLPESMLIRVFVSGFHVTWAALFATAGGLLVLQATVNARWEQGFYRATTDGTGALYLGGALMISLAVIQALSAAAFLTSTRWSAHAMIALSLFLVWTLPWPVSLLMALAAAGGWLELWARTPAPPPDPTDEED